MLLVMRKWSRDLKKHELRSSLLGMGMELGVYTGAGMEKGLSAVFQSHMYTVRMSFGPISGSTVASRQSEVCLSCFLDIYTFVSSPNPITRL
jgi:hypothetical protein